MDLTQDVRTLEELEQNPAALIRDARNHCRPLIITSKGQPDMVIVPAHIMKDKLTALRATCELAEV